MRIIWHSLFLSNNFRLIPILLAVYGLLYWNSILFHGRSGYLTMRWKRKLCPYCSILLLWAQPIEPFSCAKRTNSALECSSFLKRRNCTVKFYSSTPARTISTTSFLPVESIVALFYLSNQSIFIANLFLIWLTDYSILYNVK